MSKLINPFIFIFSLGLLIWNPSPFQILELKTFDYIMSTTPEIQNENILLVDLDEEIVEAYGGYPLPRSLIRKHDRHHIGCSRFYDSHA
jgi:CHASE2 domain-containing sensor protein